MATPNATSGSDWPSGGGRDGGWRALLPLTVPSMCWEFLRRNQTYQEHFRTLKHGAATLDRRWGLAAPADPGLPSEEARVVWRADVAPALVVPMEARSFGRAKALPDSVDGPVAAEDGRYLRLPSGLQVQLRGDATPTGPLVVVLSYDSDFNLRVRAVDALRRAETTDTPPRSRFSIEQRARLARTLFALDASLRAQSYRQIATGLFGEDSGAEDDFKASPRRDVTIRLVRRGKALMAGGYLKLLRAGF
ncbi:DUF2285 domain-containing protein [Caulobacter sp. 602-1]|uniref:DUF2285 domain-containing protein n=1 Tax=Caulobacter sp. 602-1 TaxID=2492472 RepID=UPI001F1F9D2F|nr:DUF2285 domain-containing protein [Caulobacter sp. 602-1]